MCVCKYVFVCVYGSSLALSTEKAEKSNCAIVLRTGKARILASNYYFPTKEPRIFVEMADSRTEAREV